MNAEEKLFLKCHDGLITLQLSDIIYIQTENKLLILHTIHGDVQSSQRMSELEKRLSKKQFFRCHNSYMVNFDYVEGVKKDSVLIKDKVQKLKTIPISKYKKEEFANWNSYCNVNLSSNEYKLLWESGRIFISVFLYGYIRIGASVNTGYIIYLSNKRTEEKINY